MLRSPHQDLTEPLEPTGQTMRLKARATRGPKAGGEPEAVDNLGVVAELHHDRDQE